MLNRIDMRVFTKWFLEWTSKTYVQNSSLADIFLPVITAVAFVKAAREPLKADKLNDCPNVSFNRILLTIEELYMVLFRDANREELVVGLFNVSSTPTTQFSVFHSLSQVLHGNTARKDMKRKYSVQATITL